MFLHGLKDIMPYLGSVLRLFKLAASPSLIPNAKTLHGHSLLLSLPSFITVRVRLGMASHLHCSVSSGSSLCRVLAPMPLRKARGVLGFVQRLSPRLE